MNTHTPEKITVSGAKTWNDAENQDGKRPESITVHLLADGTEVAKKTVTAADEWKWSFDGLDKYAAGKEIAYTVTEDAVTDYETAVDGYNITNTHTPEKITVSGEKTWNDAENQDGKRPESITVHLLADGTEVGKKTVTAADEWKWSFEGLDKYAAGKEIAYTITEDAVTEYDTAVDGYNITNTYLPETVRLTVRKVWVDQDDKDGIRPDSVKVTLNKDGAALAEYTLNEENKWTLTTDALPKYERGKEITYTWAETAVEGYTGAATTADGTTILTNTHELFKGSLTIRKTFNGVNGVNANVLKGLRMTVKGPDDYTLSITYADFEQGAYTIENLTPGEYSVTEVNAAGLIANYKLQAASRTTGAAIVKADETAEIALNNIYAAKPQPKPADPDPKPDPEPETPTAPEPETIDVNGQKTWIDNDDQDGVRPERVVINLYANGTLAARAQVTEASGWTWSFTGLRKYDDAGNAVVYTIEEEPVAGYTAVVNGYDVINAYEPANTSVQVIKVWNDKNDLDGSRPESVKVTLLANGEEVLTAVLSEENEWSASAVDLPMNENGKEIRYTWTEETVNGYTLKTEIIGKTTVLTNTHVPEVTKATVRKVWNDENNAQKIRPASITATLSNGMSVILNDENGWSATVEDLPVTYKGKTVEYTWKEQEAPGYLQTGVKVEGSVTTFTNEPWKRPEPIIEVPPTVRRPGKPVLLIDDYNTPLSINVDINHVGYCFD